MLAERRAELKSKIAHLEAAKTIAVAHFKVHKARLERDCEFSPAQEAQDDPDVSLSGGRSHSTGSGGLVDEGVAIFCSAHGPGGDSVCTPWGRSC